MAYRQLRTIADISRHHLKVQVTCGACGRQVIYAPSSFLVPRGRLYNKPLDEVARHMVCTPPQGCGARRATLMAIDWPPVSASPAPPKPIAEKTPRGVDPEEWAKAGESDRKRIIRRLRS